MSGFMIDTGDRFVETTALSSAVEDGQRIAIRTMDRARTMQRRILENIAAQECPAALDDYAEREAEAINAIARFRPDMADAVADAITEHRAALMHGGAYRSA